VLRRPRLPRQVNKGGATVAAQESALRENFFILKSYQTLNEFRAKTFSFCFSIKSLFKQVFTFYPFLIMAVFTRAVS
jgi:hypothetical protein